MHRSKYFFRALLLPGLLYALPAAAQPVDTLQQAGTKSIKMEEVTVGGRVTLQTPVDQLLESSPSIQMVKRGNYAWEPTIRGLQAGQINLTIDGMHIFGACTDRMDPVSSYIEPTNLKQISINTDAGFSNYGAGFGGGIDFNLKRPEFRADPAVHGTFGVGMMSLQGAWQTLGSINLVGPKLSVLANGILRKAPNYQAAGGAEVLFSQYRKWNAGLAAAYRLDTHHVLEVDYLQDEGRDIGYPALTMDVAYANAYIGSLTHRYTGSRRQVRSKVYLNYIDHAMDDSKRPAEQVPIPMDMPGRSWTGGFYTEATEGTIGLQARVSGYINRLTADMTMYPEVGAPMYMFTLPDPERIHLYLDLAKDLNLTDRLQATLNGTFSYSGSSLYTDAGRQQLSGMLAGDSPNRKDLLWNLALGTRFQPETGWVLSARAAHTMRAPTLQELYAFYIFNRLDGYDFLGNHLLDPERALNVQLSAAYATDRFHAEVSAFSYFFRDYIAGSLLSDYEVMTIGANGVKQYQNIGQATSYGGEFRWEFQLGKQIHIHGNGAFTWGADQDGHALPMIAPLHLLKGLEWSRKGYHVRADVQFDAAQNHVSTERYGEQATPSSTLFHVGGRKTFLASGLAMTASFRLENVFDAHYYHHLDIMKIPRPGRNAQLSLTVGF